MNEAEIIQRYFSHHTTDKSIVLGIGDDGAVVKPPDNHELVITTDSLVEDTHFTEKTPPAELGYKLLASNLSDLAAMSASPKWATLNLTLPAINDDWLQQFSQGFFSCAEQFNVALIGGDLTKGKQINTAVQLIGIVSTGNGVTRKGAQSGDFIYVTGAIGLAAQATELLYQHDHNHSNLSLEQHDALYHFTPRIDVGLELRGIANSAIDISDGLLHELNIICNGHGLGATIILEDLPIAKGVDPSIALNGGEDYELLFTVNSDHHKRIQEIAKKCNCPIACIGEINSKNKIELLDHGESVPLPENFGFEHFL